MAKNEFAHLNVLLVEPNSFMRSLLKEVLLAYGIKSICDALDGADALEKLKTFPADIVITELEQTPIGGIEFIQMLRKAGDSPSPFMPVIVLTSYTETHYVMDARDAGMTEFLAKPITAESLYSRIKAVMARPRQFVTAGKFFGPDRRRRDVGALAGKRRKSDLEEADNDISPPGLPSTA